MLSQATHDLIGRALAEDVGLRDVTTEAVVPPGVRARATIEQKAPGVLFGLEVAEAVFRRLDRLLAWRPARAEGEWLAEPPAVVAEIEGDARALLTGERVALNFLQRLSGIASATASCVELLRGSGVEVLDTRKTTPGLRDLEKQAVAAGGGRNHRMRLDDAILVKDNHIAVAGGIREAVRRALERRPPGITVEVECSSLADVSEALEAGATHLLLDNMAVDEMRAARAAAGSEVVLEASGGITPASLGSLRDAGLQFVSLGFLTHSPSALDLSMSIEPLEVT
ncbi:MAG: nicotinate-nucleotide diphosphorylase (carboxylating) [Candidatus Rokuibacteriota bacterium]|nr:MAG: nicotinate-nucleotide diphosphorylase (carboxylating) [Candidatus Rokubacteria bacterium]